MSNQKSLDKWVAIVLVYIRFFDCVVIQNANVIKHDLFIGAEQPYPVIISDRGPSHMHLFQELRHLCGRG